MRSDPEDLVTTAEAGIILRSHPSNVTRFVKSKKLKPVIKLVGLRGAYLFNRADVVALAEERTASKGGDAA